MQGDAFAWDRQPNNTLEMGPKFFSESQEFVSGKPRP
jgi:hypothetical protein